MGRKFQFPHIVVIDQEIDRINAVFFSNAVEEKVQHLKTLHFYVKMYFFNRINFPLCSFMIVTRHYIVTCIMNTLFFNMNNNNLCYFRN